jgi:pimeloyl-ACP methyl ester carboxylesterase
MRSISEAEDKFVTANDLSLHYLDWGNPDEPPMVLLHGLCVNAHYWDLFALTMKQNYHVLALDQRGHGDSTWSRDYGPKYYVLDLEAFAVKLSLTDMVLIGHSMGGINAIIYAASHPEMVSHLVIVDIGPEIADAGIDRIERERVNEPESFSSEDEAISYMRRLEPRQSDDFIYHQVKYALRREENGRLKFKYDEALRNTELRSPEWLWDYLGQVICPSLVLHGSESDMLLTGVAERASSALPFGSLVEIEGAGHSIPGDNPKAFEAAVRQFLSSHQSFKV